MSKPRFYHVYYLANIQRFTYFIDWKDDLKVTGDTVYVIGALVGFGGSAMLITSLAITAELVGNNVAIHFVHTNAESASPPTN